MDTCSRTTSPTSDVELKQEQSPPVQDKISAYYSLVFPHFTFYIQTLSITIGRRCTPNPSAPTSSTGEQAQIDVDLGALKSVSRLHAKIEYDQEEDRFVLVVVGRNGAWVDGVWCGAGSRAVLGERSHIQIASRTFTFVLPPPPPPEDSPSPSSQSSANRARSPSVDITSISPPSSQPSHSPPPKKARVPPPSPEPQIDILPDPEPAAQPKLPNSNSIGKGKGVNPKKRKKGDVDPPALERPEVMPPKPPYTYAQLIYRAIKSIDGKATLQEICNWIMTTYDYYKYADSAWMSSVRHNLSSGRAFVKMERCGGDRGKGFFWSVDEKYTHIFEEQEAKAAQNMTSQATGGKDGSGKPGRRKDKNTPLEPPLKRSVKGDVKGPLPPPLTSAPLVPKTAAATSSAAPVAPAPAPNPNTNAATGVFAYNTHVQAPSSSSTSTSYASSKNPYSALTQPYWNMHQPSTSNSTLSATTALPRTTLQPAVSATPAQNSAVPPSSSSPTPVPPATRPALPPINTNASQGLSQNGIPDVVIPIVRGPIPPTHPDYVAGQPNNSAKAGYMILHERKLILDPDVFSDLSTEKLQELEKMGAMAAVKVLTEHMVKALKERRAKNKNKDKSAKKAAKAARKAAAAAAAVASSANVATANPTAGTTGVNAVTNTPILGTSTTNASAPTAEAKAVDPATSTGGPMDITPSDAEGGVADPGTPIVIIDDSEDEGPAPKRRKLDSGMDSAESIPMVA